MKFRRALGREASADGGVERKSQQTQIFLCTKALGSDRSEWTGLRGRLLLHGRVALRRPRQRQRVLRRAARSRLIDRGASLREVEPLKFPEKSW